MTQRFRLVANDTRAEVQAQLSQFDQVLDISDAAVSLKFKAADDDTILADIDGELLPGTMEEDGRTPDLSQYPTPGSGGRVKFKFPDGSLNVAPGNYVGEIEVLFAGSTVGTVFDKLRFVVRADMG